LPRRKVRQIKYKKWASNVTAKTAKKPAQEQLTIKQNNYNINKIILSGKRFETDEKKNRGQQAKKLKQWIASDVLLTQNYMREKNYFFHRIVQNSLAFTEDRNKIQYPNILLTI
jgi:hypothetical protein